MRTNYSVIYMAVFALALTAANGARALDCAVPAEVAACASNADCGCGANTVTGACQVGAPTCLAEGGGCAGFCTGYGGIVRVCRSGECVRARSTWCPGDCDADAQVDITELMKGVAIALERQPMSVCDAFDRDVSQHVEVPELVRGVRAALHGCVAELDAASRAKFYDAQVTYDSAGTVEAIGHVDQAGSTAFIDLQTAPNEYLQLSGTRAGDEVALLDGSYMFTDIYVQVTGSAHFRNDPDARVVVGELASQNVYGNEPTGFVMRRSNTLTPERFAGRYELHFPGSPSGAGASSRATVTLDVGPNGLGLMTEAADVGNDAAPLGTITTSDCQVAPEGHLSCTSLYLIAASGEGNLLRMTGLLSPADDGNVSGGGAFLAGVDPPFSLDLYVYGTWSAVRLPASGS